MKALGRAALATAISIFSASPHAQPAVAPLTEPAPKGLQGIPLRGNEFSTATPLLQADFSNDEKVGTVKLGGWRPFKNKLTIATEFKAPFDKTNASSEIADFDGLRENTSAALILGYRQVGSVEGLSVEDATDRCKRLWLDGAAPTTCSAANIEKNARDFFKKKVQEKTEKEACTQYLGKDTDCTEDAFAKHRRRLYTEDRAEYANKVIKGFTGGLRGEYGQKKFEYFDATTLSSDKDREDAYSVSAGFGYISNRSFYGVGFQYLKSFKDAKEQTFCLPSDTPPGSSRCDEGPIGPPAETTRNNGFVEWRWQPRGLPVALSPRAVFDFKSDEWAFRLPIYLVGNADDAFTGGVRLEWDTEEEDLQGVVFIGKAFQFID